MEEIEGRFELIRIAVHLGDYEVIDTQIRRLRNMSTDKHLHAILYELESKNFRQALYMMRDYAETLRDDFFNPPISEPSTSAVSPAPMEDRFAGHAATPAGAYASPSSHTRSAPQTRHPEGASASTPEPAYQPEPKKPAPDLFNLEPPVSTASDSEHAITLDEMLAMTRESATAPRSYQAPEPLEKPEPEPVEPKQPQPVPEPETPAATPAAEPQAAVFMTPETERVSDEPDPLFTLDQDIATEPEPVSAPEPQSEPVSRPEQPSAAARASDPASPAQPARREEAAAVPPVEMTPLFGGGDELELGDDLLSFPPVSDAEETPEEAPVTAETPTDEGERKSDTGIFTLDDPDFFEMETPVTPEPEVTPAPVSQPRTPVSPVARDSEPATAAAEETPQIRESAVAPESTEPLEPVSVTEETVTAPEPDTVPPAAVEEDPRPRRWEFEPDEDDIMYEKFSYMGQKFRIMMHRYPLKEEVEGGVIDEVKDFIHMVSVRDYSESQVEAAIARYQELKEQGRIGEAAQMLIAAATTESRFAQFMLARELFKGEVLQQDFPESFTQINRLAEEDYPEAICDLGQLYEYGIGIDKNKQHALRLYEEAAHMGVERAQRHYDRLRSSNPLQSIKSFTRALLGKKK